MSRARTWCFTLNNPTDYLDFTKHPSVTYAIYQTESGEQGTRHYQGYIEVSKATVLSTMKKMIPGAHFEQRRGTREQARDYCMKEDTRLDGPYEYGDFGSKKPGTRNDLKAACDIIRDGGGLKRVAEEFPDVLAKYSRGLAVVEEYLRPPPLPPKYSLGDFNHPPLDLTLPVLLVGPTGCGKTQFAKAHFEHPLLVRHLDALHKVNGADGIVFDDMCFSHLHFTAIMVLLDMEEENPVHTRYHNATMPQGIKRIFVYNTRNALIPLAAEQEQYRALARRYTIVEVTGKLYGPPEKNYLDFEEPE
nr:MAG: replication associated protein [Arizlama virus]